MVRRRRDHPGGDLCDGRLKSQNERERRTHLPGDCQGAVRHPRTLDVHVLRVLVCDDRLWLSTTYVIKIYLDP